VRHKMRHKNYPKWSQILFEFIFYFARTSRHNVDKMNFMKPKEKLGYACNTMPILVWGKNICMYATSKINWLHFFPKACYGFCKNDLYLKMTKNVWNEGIPIKIMGNSMIGHGCCCVILYFMTNAQCRL
jgi:hypothetical protein